MSNENNPLIITHIPDDDILAQGVNMMISDDLKPNAQYVLKKIRDVCGGESITPSLLMQLTLQAMMFSASSGPGLGGRFKKEIVMHALRKLVLDADNKSIDIASKTALFMLLQDNGAVSTVIDNLVIAANAAANIDFKGMTNRFGCKCFGQKPKPLPADFNKDDQ